MKTLEIVLYILGILGLAFFAGPVFAGVFNLGNAAGIVVSLLLLTAAAETTFMGKALDTRPEPGTPAIVLGCSVKGTEPSLSLLERIDAAYKYLTAPGNEDAVAVLSGGRGQDEGISEAECMFRGLTARGIDPERLLLEDQSRSTAENLAFSRKILDEKGLGTRVALVTSEYHMYRAFLIAKGAGLEPGAVPAGTAFWLFPTFYLRELFGILYQKVCSL